jgi:hypothetical protein
VVDVVPAHPPLANSDPRRGQPSGSDRHCPAGWQSARHITEADPKSTRWWWTGYRDVAAQ